MLLFLQDATGRVFEAFLLTAFRNRMRLATRGFSDATEIEYADGQWKTEEGAPIEIAGLIANDPERGCIPSPQSPIVCSTLQIDICLPSISSPGLATSFHTKNERVGQITMRLKSMTAIFALAISAIVFLGPTAKADDFSFSFTNTLGTVPGAVTGEILGLTNNSTSAATQVIIETFPPALNAPFSPPLDATLWSDQLENSFTEEAGVIVSGGFQAQTTFDVLGIATLSIDASGFNGLSFCHCVVGVSPYVEGDPGLAAANIQPLSSPVPEPTSVIFLITMLLAVAFMARKKQPTTPQPHF